MKKKTKIIIMTILVLILVVCASVIGIYYYKQYQAKKLYDSMKQDTTQQETTSEEESEVEIPVDFAALQKQNPDIYAWITIPGTVIDYPILHSEEDTDYYLNHTPEKVEGLPGSIYTQNANAADFTDGVTVIYGHNMKNKTMFGELHNYEDEEFFQNNRVVYIYTPEHILTYKIFAAHVYDNRLIIDSFDILEESGVQKYLDSIYASRNMVNHFDDNTQVTGADRIITLSTCMAGQDTKRYLVQAVLVDEQ